MSIKKQVLTGILVMTTSIFYANHPPTLNLDKYIASDKVIVQFSPKIGELEIRMLLMDIGFANPEKSVVLYTGGIAIVKLAGHQNENIIQLRQYIQSMDNVLNVNPVIRYKESEIGILNEVFVKLKSKADFQTLISLAKKMRVQEVTRSPYLQDVVILHIGKHSTNNSLEICAQLRSLDIFDYVEPNLLFNPILTTNDPHYPRQWHLQNDGSAAQHNGTPGADMSIEDAWLISMGDSSIKVAVLDSGVDTLHVDLKDNMLPGYDATGGGSKGFPSNKFDSDGHGTACSGIIAAATNNGTGVAGVAPNCKIIPVKLFYYIDTTLNSIPLNDIPFSTSQWMADGIGWATQAGADIMSCSWAVPDFLFTLFGNISLVEDAIDQAVQSGRGGKGIPMLFSTGNEDAAPLWPSRLANTIAVTATSMCDERKSPTSCDGENWGGNYGNNLDIAAPGVKIVTTDMTGRDGFANGSYVLDFNGTSAACPNAAGVMALILSVRPDLTFWDARYIMGATADKVGGYNYNAIKYAGTWSGELGFGRVNAHKALQTAINYTYIDKPETVKDIKLFPNPLSGGVITVEYNSTITGSLEIDIMNQEGQLIKIKELTATNGNNRHAIIIKSLPVGMYVLKLSIDGLPHYRKFIVLNNNG